MRISALFFIWVLFCEPLCAQNTGTFITYKYPSSEYNFSRVFDAALKDPKWVEAKSLKDRIWVLYKAASKYDTESKPVSDRYAISAYGGPIDLVHFFGLAAQTLDRGSMEEHLYKQWIDEGGFENLRGFNYQQAPEAHPDDLPSNALGALFADELKKKKASLDTDIRKEFEGFIEPFLPVPDSIAKEYSHSAIVMGYSSEKPTEKEVEHKTAWFTAEPMVRTDLINAIARIKTGKSFCQSCANGRDALAIAGFKLEKYKQRTIIIRRVETGTKKELQPNP